jgi:RHS repeat-associated protein
LNLKLHRLINVKCSKATYRVGIRNSTDYSPFGVELDGRTVSLEGYRFGYQGSEKDNEFKGEGNSYTTEFRQLDTRLGRWLSVDPMYAKFPWQSPYVSFDNNPICFKDPLGMESVGGPGDGKRISKSDAHDWERRDVLETETNIIRALERKGVGGYGEVKYSTGRSFIWYRSGFVCTESNNYKKDNYYDKFTIETSFKYISNEGRGDYPESLIYKDKITNTFVIRGDYVFHEQKIERTEYYFSKTNGEYLFTQTITKTIQEKQYFDNNYSDQKHLALNPYKFYSKVSVDFGPRKVENIEITNEMKNLIKIVIREMKSQEIEMNLVEQNIQLQFDYINQTIKYEESSNN